MRRVEVRCEESRELSDWSEEEIASAGGIVFKSDKAWQEAYFQTKSVHSTREHVPSGPARRQVRIARAEKARTMWKRERR